MKLTETQLRNLIKQQITEAMEANTWFTKDQRHKNYEIGDLDSATQKVYYEGHRDGIIEERNNIAEYLREQGEEELAEIVANGGARPY